MIKEHNHIKRLTEDFLLDDLIKEDPAGLCFATCYPLHIYLLAKDILNEINHGVVPVPKPENENNKIPHYWLQIDKHKTILDPTINQFNIEDQSYSMYIGKLKGNEITKKYIVDDSDFNEWFWETYDLWKIPFEDPTYDINEFVNRYFLYQLKLACRLHTELNSIRFSDSIFISYYHYYFTPIFHLLYNWKNGVIKIDFDVESMPANFDNMLQEALEWMKYYDSP